MCVKNQQIHQLFIQFINYVWLILHVSALHRHPRGEFLVPFERCSVEEHLSEGTRKAPWGWQLVHLLVFRAYINEMHGSRSKIPTKNFVRQRCTEGFNSGVKGLTSFRISGVLLYALPEKIPFEPKRIPNSSIFLTNNQLWQTAYFFIFVLSFPYLLISNKLTYEVESKIFRTCAAIYTAVTVARSTDPNRPNCEFRVLLRSFASTAWKRAKTSSRTLARTDLAASPWQHPVSHFLLYPGFPGETRNACHPPPTALP
jgi:hypothetical protein